MIFVDSGIARERAPPQLPSRGDAEHRDRAR